MRKKHIGFSILLSALLVFSTIGFAGAETLTDGSPATGTDVEQVDEGLLPDMKLVVPLGSAEALGLTEEHANNYIIDSSNTEIAEVKLHGEAEKEYFVYGKKSGKTKINIKNILGEVIESREVEVSREAAIRAKLLIPKLEAKLTTSSTVLKLMWEKVEDVDGYRIYKWNSAKRKYVLIKTITGNDVTVWRDRKLTPDKKYTYKIATYINSDGKTYIGQKSEKTATFLTANARVYTPEVEYTDSAEGELRLLDKSLGYKDGKLYYEAVIVNDNELYTESFKLITISVSVNGKLVAKQDFIDTKINLDAFSSKSITFNFDTGTKKVVNLRDGEIKVSFDGIYKYAELKIKEF